MYDGELSSMKPIFAKVFQVVNKIQDNFKDYVGQLQTSWEREDFETFLYEESVITPDIL